MIDESRSIYRHFKYDPRDSSSISNNEIRSIFQDSDGEIWIGTEGGGLNRWLGGERFDRIKAVDGLIADNVMGITQDIKGSIWVSTFQGVSRIDKKSKKIKNFNFRSFQSTNQFNQSAILTDREGKIFFGGINGLK
jgi:ligand-binding sensor domain-containing protein